MKKFILKFTLTICLVFSPWVMAEYIDAYITGYGISPLCFTNPENTFERWCVNTAVAFYDENTPDTFGQAVSVDYNAPDFIYTALMEVMLAKRKVRISNDTINSLWVYTYNN